VSGDSLIHDQGYQRYRGRRAANGRSWTVIARQHILPMIRRRGFVALLLFAWTPFVVRAVQIYLAANVPQAAMLQATPQTFREFLGQQSLFVFLVSIAQAGLIADDRRANALQIYLSKPLTRVEYIAGKLVALLTYLLAVTLVPALLLLALQVMFAGSVAFVRDNLFLIPAIVVYSLTQTLLTSFSLLALSSLSKSRRFVSVMYAGIIFFTAAMYQALRNITASDAWAWISPGDTLSVIADTVFRVKTTHAIPPVAAMAVVIVLIGAAVAVLERRVRGVEVVT
jgi:ABC-2 type transport system permease protein